MGAISLKECKLDRFGLLHDRRWMVVDTDGNFLTQRQHAEMCLFEVNQLDDGLQILHKKQSHIDIKVPFEPLTQKSIEVTVWNDKCKAIIVDENIDKQLSSIFKQPVHLVKMPESEIRQVDTSYTPQGTITAFTDGFPLLMISQESLDLLNSKLEKPVGMLRFRPNLVITGGDAHVEDQKAKFTIDSCVFEGVKPCSRCVVTTIEPNTAIKRPEPLRTLTQYRIQDGKVMFGMNVFHHHSNCSIKVGSSINY